MLFFVSPENQPAVRKSLNGFIEVPFQFEQEGSRVVMG
jgi:hypothetical protein